MGLNDAFRTLLKAHVKGHTRVINGKVVYVHDYDSSKPQGQMAQLHERTVIGKHRSGTHYLRATDAEDGQKIQEVADRLGIKTDKRRAGANHHGRIGAYDHFHVENAEHALAIHNELKKQPPEVEGEGQKAHGNASTGGNPPIHGDGKPPAEPPKVATGGEEPDAPKPTTPPPAPAKQADPDYHKKALELANNIKGNESGQRWSKQAHDLSEKAIQSGKAEDHEAAAEEHLNAAMDHEQGQEDTGKKAYGDAHQAHLMAYAHHKKEVKRATELTKEPITVRPAGEEKRYAIPPKLESKNYKQEADAASKAAAEAANHAAYSGVKYPGSEMYEQVAAMHEKAADAHELAHANTNDDGDKKYHQHVSGVHRSQAEELRKTGKQADEVKKKYDRPSLPPPVAGQRPTEAQDLGHKAHDLHTSAKIHERALQGSKNYGHAHTAAESSEKAHIASLQAQSNGNHEAAQKAHERAHKDHSELAKRLEGTHYDDTTDSVRKLAELHKQHAEGHAGLIDAASRPTQKAHHEASTRVVSGKVVQVHGYDTAKIASHANDLTQHAASLGKRHANNALHMAKQSHEALKGRGYEGEKRHRGLANDYNYVAAQTSHYKGTDTPESRLHETYSALRDAHREAADSMWDSRKAASPHAGVKDGAGLHDKA